LTESKFAPLFLIASFAEPVLWQPDRKLPDEKVMNGWISDSVCKYNKYRDNGNGRLATGNGILLLVLTPAPQALKTKDKREKIKEFRNLKI